MVLSKDPEEKKRSQRRRLGTTILMVKVYPSKWFFAYNQSFLVWEKYSQNTSSTQEKVLLENEKSFLG